MHTGSCLCGAVRFEIEGDLEPIQFCHCSVCRRANGTAFGANIPVASDAFRFVAGQDGLSSYESSPGKHRVFCRACGGPIFSRLDANPVVVRVRAGTLDAPTGATPGFHFYTASKADWWEITDDLPAYPDARPA